LEFYEREAEVYDDVRFSSLVGGLVNAIQKDIVTRLCDFNDGDFVLDVGTGTGRFAVELAKSGATVVGLDPSKSMIKIARKKSIQRGVYRNVNLVIADAHKLPFKKSSFQCCISINVLNHIRDYKSVLVEIGSVLKEKGWLVANFSNMQGLYLPVAVFVNSCKRALFSDVYSRWFTLNEVKKSLFKVGLRVEDVEGFFVLILPSFLQRFSCVTVHIIRKMNALFSSSVFKYLSGSLFVKSQKIFGE